MIEIKEKDKSKITELHVFDIDGTLSINYFDHPPLNMVDFAEPDLLAPCIGSFEQYMRYSMLHKDCYRDCKPIPQVQEYIRKLSEKENVLCFALTLDINSRSYLSKCKFIKEHYPEIEEVISVSTDEYKIDVMHALGIEYKLKNMYNIFFYEDTLPTIIAARKKGIRAYHVTHILDKEFPYHDM